MGVGRGHVRAEKTVNGHDLFNQLFSLGDILHSLGLKNASQALLVISFAASDARAGSLPTYKRRAGLLVLHGAYGESPDRQGATALLTNRARRSG